MIIDFHTHIFPDKIAAKTIAILSEKGGIPAHSDGTERGLLEKMAIAGVDVSVSLPVLTSPSQFDSITSFAHSINEKYRGKERRIISFAGIHPDSEDIDCQMKRIKELGFSGVKIHPDYQGVFIDDERYVRILECAKEYDLILITHAGADVAFRGQDVRCTPERALRLIRRVPYSKLVLAHMGGNEMPEGVLDILAGEDVYFDTSFVLGSTPRETFIKFIEKHGIDRLLFGSDSPWSDMAKDAGIIKSFSLNKDDEEKIFSGNARRLLGI